MTRTPQKTRMNYLTWCSV